MMKVNILGTKYTIREVPRGKDRILETCDGYCDKTSKKIVIALRDADCDFENFEVYRKKVMRHEIIHAFLFESGLQENFEHNQFGHDETFLDWVAVQYPKLKRAFAEAGCDE